jgi:hypothetical protein
VNGKNISKPLLSSRGVLQHHVLYHELLAGIFISVILQLLAVCHFPFHALLYGPSYPPLLPADYDAIFLTALVSILNALIGWFSSV